VVEHRRLDVAADRQVDRLGGVDAREVGDGVAAGGLAVDRVGLRHCGLHFDDLRLAQVPAVGVGDRVGLHEHRRGDRPPQVALDLGLRVVDRSGDRLGVVVGGRHVEAEPLRDLLDRDDERADLLDDGRCWLGHPNTHLLASMTRTISMPT
jgi:hypothetical protein